MFSIKESVKYGWAKFKENASLSVLTTLLMLAVASLGSGKRMEEAFLFGIAMIVLLLIIRIGYTKMYLRMHDGEKPHFTDIFTEYHLFWKYLGTSILQGLAMIGGLILLIVPGIIWGVRFSFAPIIIIDAKTSPMNAMRESYRITAGSFWHLLGLWIVIGLINLLGLIIFGVGLLVSVPLSTFAVIHIYRKLSAAKAAVSTVPPVSPVTA